MDHIIRPEWFEAMASWQLLLVGAVGLYLLTAGADLLVGGASAMALRMGMSKVIIGATVVSLGTTTPECAVSVVAAWNGQPALALGNAVGSVIADTALIFGLGCLMARIPVDRFVVRRQGWVQFGSGVLLAGLSYGAWVWNRSDPTLGRSVGLLLLALLGVYLAFSIRWGRQHGEMLEAETEEVLEEVQRVPWFRTILRFFAGLIMVLIFSDVVVECAQQLALRLGVPPVVIASTIVAVGTSLPEMVIGLTAVRRGHPQLLLGNIIGADVLNVLFVTGAAATAAPLPILDHQAARPEIFLLLHLPAMLLVLALFRVYIMAAMRRGYFSRWFGGPLLALYGVYLALNLWAAGPG